MVRPGTRSMACTAFSIARDCQASRAHQPPMSIDEKPPPRAGSTLATLTRDVSGPPNTIVQADVERCQRVPAASLHRAKPRSPRSCGL